MFAQRRCLFTEVPVIDTAPRQSKVPRVIETKATADQQAINGFYTTKFAMFTIWNSLIRKDFARCSQH